MLELELEGCRFIAHWDSFNCVILNLIDKWMLLFAALGCVQQSHLWTLCLKQQKMLSKHKHDLFHYLCPIKKEQISFQCRHASLQSPTGLMFPLCLYHMISCCSGFWLLHKAMWQTEVVLTSLSYSRIIDTPAIISSAEVIRLPEKFAETWS